MNTANRARASKADPASRPPPPPRRSTNRAPITSPNSGTYVRPIVDEEHANRDDMADFHSLVRLASSRPPRPTDESDDALAVTIPPLLHPPIFGSERPPIESYIAELRGRGAPADRPSLAWTPKAMVVIPWTLLVLGAVGVGSAWPNASEAGPSVAVSDDARADDPVGGIRSSVEESGAIAPSATPGESGRQLPEASAAEDDSDRSRSTRDETRDVRRERGAALVAGATAPTDPAAPEPTTVAPTAPAEAPAVTASEGTSNVAFRMDHVIASVERGAADESASGGAESNAPQFPAPASALPERPSRSDVASALRRVRGAVAACMSAPGNVTVRIVISGDGTVASAQATGPTAGTAEGACIANAVRRARFPAFSANSMTVDFPFSLH